MAKVPKSHGIREEYLYIGGAVLAVGGYYLYKRHHQGASNPGASPAPAGMGSGVTIPLNQSQPFGPPDGGGSYGGGGSSIPITPAQSVGSLIPPGLTTPASPGPSPLTQASLISQINAGAYALAPPPGVTPIYTPAASPTSSASEYYQDPGLPPGTGITYYAPPAAR